MTNLVFDLQSWKAVARIATSGRAVTIHGESNLRGDPYLSIVIASRNDDHGGNMLQRMQASLNGLLLQLEEYRIESELILVDWNPPADKPLLKDVVKWPKKLNHCTIRVIVVPYSIHQRYQYSENIPVNAVVAVNCGIRRARGQFILPGVVDLLYSHELMSYIASKSLRTDERYRVDRYDVERNVVQYDTLEEQLGYCENNIIHINSHAPPANRPLRWIQRSLPDLHTEACGDFQLMSKQYWHKLRGYREADIIAAHVDSLLSYASYAAGVREVVFSDPIRIYHIDHDDKFNNRIERSKLPFEGWLSSPFIPAWLGNKVIALYRIIAGFMGYRFKSSFRGVPTLDPSEYQRMCKDIVAGRIPCVFNNDNWGLGEESLEEFVINTADWDKDS